MNRKTEHYSASEPDEGELSDTGEKQEVTEDMNYRETVRSVRSFMGWNHIPVFEADFSEPDKSNNPWKAATLSTRLQALTDVLVNCRTV